ncbi:MAG: L-sorbosone dehydrogenase [Pirellulaceae bacterium]
MQRQWICLFAIAVLGSCMMTRAGVAQDAKENNPAKVAGFQVEKLYDVPQQQGSWVSMTVDNQGRLIASDQYGGLYRITVGDKLSKVEDIPVKSGRAHGLLYAFDALYVMSHEGDGQPAGLYRVTDTNNDDYFDKVELVLPIQGGGEHGPHAIVLSPDKKSLYICAGNHTKLPEITGSRVPQNWDEDQVVPRMWDANGHAAGIMAPGGWVCRVSPDGKECELITIGYRNEYDIAFNPNGELFTYDADMEWDIGLPWYRPTRICQSVDGGEFGWRSGTGKWPVYYADSLPPVVDIGPASPTGITFGTGARFPSKYQNALFAADWSYGVIYAIHMTPEGASYRGEKEVFATAPGMAVTDMVVNPQDGALYYLIGGRRSRSALFRATYNGDESTDPAPFPALTELAQQRKALESLLSMSADNAEQIVTEALPFLGHEDRFIRFAARVALERMPVETWGEKALAVESAQGKLEAAMAIARCGDDPMAEKAIGLLQTLRWEDLSNNQKLHLLRDIGLVATRHPEVIKPLIPTSGEHLLQLLPSSDPRINMELARLACGLDVEGAVPAVMSLMVNSGSQEEQIHYAFCLRVATKGWTPELRDKYFQWFVDAGKFRGGNSFAKFLMNARNEAVERLPAAEKERLATLINTPPASVAPTYEVEQRAVVKKWEMSDFGEFADAELSNRDLANGAHMFAVGQCYKCHQLSGNGGSVGPDLTNAGRRFDANDLLETLIVPSKEVSDQYRGDSLPDDRRQTDFGSDREPQRQSIHDSNRYAGPRKLHANSG